jgi:hypothetical protein
MKLMRFGRHSMRKNEAPVFGPCLYMLHQALHYISMQTDSQGYALQFVSKVIVDGHYVSVEGA